MQEGDQGAGGIYNGDVLRHILGGGVGKRGGDDFLGLGGGDGEALLRGAANAVCGICLREDGRWEEREEWDREAHCEICGMEGLLGVWV